MVLLIALHASSSSIPQTQPTVLHPSWIVTVQQTFLFFKKFWVPCFGSTILSWIDGVFKYNDSVINLHRICQNLGNCLCFWHFVSSDGSRNFRQFLSVCTYKIVSIEWLNPVPVFKPAGNSFKDTLRHSCFNEVTIAVEFQEWAVWV